MEILVGLENGYEGRRSLAWALDYPGCFAYGVNEREALDHIGIEFERYKAWINRHTPDSWLADDLDVDTKLCEVWNVYQIDNDFNRVESGAIEINAWFTHDWRPLTKFDFQRGLMLLEFSRQDLLEICREIPSELLDREYPGERWSIRGILKHIGNAEWWYLDRLDLAGMDFADLPLDVFERMSMVRKRLIEVLPELEGVELVRGKKGEWWSPRKVLRRAVEHELDHIGHIRKLLSQ